MLDALLHYLPYGLFFGLVASIISTRKGKNGLNWFLVGLFMGLVGVLLAIVLPPDQGPSDPP